MQNPLISIHALREEGDTQQRRTWSIFSNFYPRPPRGGRPYNGSMFTKSFEISIHALREEGDVCRQLLTERNSIISIHALREEGDRAPAKAA